MLTCREAGRATAMGGHLEIARDWIGARPHGHSVVEIGTGPAWFRALSSYERGARPPRERTSVDRCIRGSAGLGGNLRGLQFDHRRSRMRVLARALRVLSASQGAALGSRS